jgi:hypothetical protein
MTEKTLFHHINNVTYYKNKDYYNSLTDSEKTNFSEFMINRLCSLDIEFVVACDIINSYIGKLPNEQIRDLMFYLYPDKKPKMKFR